jgi:hypothetical protein
LLYAAELMQAWTIFNSSEGRKMKLVVALVVLVDTVGSAAACVHTYYVRLSPSHQRLRSLITTQQSVLLWGNLSAELARVYWPYPLLIASSAFNAAIVHTYLLHRFFTLFVLSRPPNPPSLMRRRSRNHIVAGALAIIALTAVRYAPKVASVLD